MNREQIEEWMLRPHHALNGMDVDTFRALCDLALSGLLPQDELCEAQLRLVGSRTRAEEAERKLVETEMMRLNNGLFVEQWSRLTQILGIEKCGVIDTVDAVECKLKRQCKCAFSSGGVLKKSCEYHNQREKVAKCNALEQAKAECAKVNRESGGEQYNMFGHNLAKQCEDAIRALMKEGGE